MVFRIDTPKEELRKRSIFLATPMYGGMCTGMFTQCVMDLGAICAKEGIVLQVFFLSNESLITRARAYCCDEFMRSKCTHMLFIDSDIGFSPVDVIAMLAMMGDNDDYDIVTAAYPKKCISWEKIKIAVEKGAANKNPNNLENFVGDYVFNPRANTKSIPIGQPVEVMEAGTGFMMVKRKTFETFNAKFPHMLYRPDHVRTAAFDGSREIMMYFDTIIDRQFHIGDLKNLLKEAIDTEGLDFEQFKAKAKEVLSREDTASKRYLSEDYYFCQNAWAIGLHVWLCPWMKLKHAGSYVFGGSLLDLAQIQIHPTAEISQLQKNREAERNAGRGGLPIKPKALPVVLPGLPTKEGNDNGLLQKTMVADGTQGGAAAGKALEKAVTASLSGTTG